MTSAANGSGFIPPRQARSRAALERLLAAAEEVLATQGLDEFTIAAVAEQAGVSVGGVYRRFTGKDQLLEAVIDRSLDQLQAAVATALGAAVPSLSGAVSAFTHALATYLARVGPVYSAILSAPRPTDKRERGLAAVTTLQRLFLDAALPHSEEIAHGAPSTALTIVLRTILASGVHRAAVTRWWPDGLSWVEWADEIADMTTSYLMTGP